MSITNRDREVEYKVQGSEAVNDTTDSGSKKLYKVRIEEIYARTILVEAEDAEDAYDLTYDLMTQGLVILDTCDDFSDDIVEVQGEANKVDLGLFGEPYSQKTIDEWRSQPIPPTTNILVCK